MPLYDTIFDLCIRRGFLIPSGEIYNPLGGLYDYGPLGCLLRQRLINLWRSECVRKEGYVEIDGSVITKQEVLEASGHVTGFVDPVVRCSRCTGQFRADHLIEEKTGEKLEGASTEILNAKLAELKFKCPDCGSALLPVENFKMMFDLKVGAGEGLPAFLRPETAQTIFVDFPRLFKTQREKLPLGVSQIGRSFRNEISPRQGLLRMREFTQMEVEIFLDPSQLNSHPNWPELKDTKLTIVTRDDMTVETTAADAAATGLVPNQYLAYWLAKEFLFYQSLGVPAGKLRFRHLSEKETPFYSKANFDLEVETSYGWKETIGNAYRTDHDLKSHSTRSGKDLSVMFNGKKLLPHVVEPSWGLDRMFFCTLEHAYRDDGRGWSHLAFPRLLAPVQIVVAPLMKRDGLDEAAKKLWKQLLATGYDCQYDDSASIGKRYARADEIGVPLVITIDYETLDAGSVTFRDRDSMKQVRVPLDAIVSRICDFFGGASFESLGAAIK